MAHKKLFIPGPTEVREEILKAQAQWMIGHRSKDFGELNKRVVEKTKQILNTKNYVMWFTSSGTGSFATFALSACASACAPSRSAPTSWMPSRSAAKTR